MARKLTWRYFLKVSKVKRGYYKAEFITITTEQLNKTKQT